MSDVEIDREAAIAQLLGEASLSEMRRVAEWRAASPENEEEYRKLERFLVSTDRLSSPQIDSVPPSPSAIAELARRRRRDGDPSAKDPLDSPLAASVSGGSPSTSGRRASAWWIASSIAAGLVAGLGLGSWLSEPDPAPSPGTEVVATGPRDVVTVTLDDGSLVRVGPDSRLVVARTAGERGVSLVGRAYFAVAHDESRPFRVRLPSGSLEVLGTRFDALGRGDEVRVAVVEGEVRLEAGGARLNVRERQVGRAAEGMTPVVDEDVDVFGDLGWLGGTLMFESTPFDNVAAELEGRFGVQVRIRDPAIGDRTVTGLFTDESPQEMIDAICRALDAECTVQDGVVVVGGPS